MLQVIIGYGPFWCKHTALRLTTPEKEVLFWDPGGAYSHGSQQDRRERDLVIIDPPDLETYLEFRWACEDHGVEVFEWYISKDYADILHNILRNGTRKDHPAGRFYTSTPGLFCSVAVSDFLNRFAANLMDVPEKYFFPHNLSRQLYSQSPDRVLVFPKNNDFFCLSPARTILEKSANKIGDQTLIGE